ncbi:protein of unknown function (plasmid) [Azospirillum baldaniorum]|uniref:Uncharacterized protein n=1 Tax=Azospirillum baldaniorum TaxID=1064539 RepID=A0A9P1NPB4_9PROT|nr:protein of unknown function [Azospirillum baldaniorum]
MNSRPLPYQGSALPLSYGSVRRERVNSNPGGPLSKGKISKGAFLSFHPGGARRRRLHPAADAGHLMPHTDHARPTGFPRG